MVKIVNLTPDQYANPPLSPNHKFCRNTSCQARIGKRKLRCPECQAWQPDGPGHRDRGPKPGDLIIDVRKTQQT